MQKWFQAETSRWGRYANELMNIFLGWNHVHFWCETRGDCNEVLKLYWTGLLDLVLLCKRLGWTLNIINVSKTTNKNNSKDENEKAVTSYSPVLFQTRVIIAKTETKINIKIIKKSKCFTWNKINVTWINVSDKFFFYFIIFNLSWCTELQLKLK